MWNKKSIVLGSGISAGVNFINSIILAKFLSLEILGLWLAIRSFCQVLGIFTLGVPNYLLLSKEQSNKINSIAFFITIPYTIVVVGISNLFNHYSGYTLPTVVLALSLYLGGIGGLNSRANQNGRKLFFGNLIDSAMGIVLIPLLYLYPNLSLFIYLQSLRFLVAFLYQFEFASFKYESVRIEDFKKYTSLSFPIHFRSWIQTISQYGDRLVVPAIWGLATAGAFGIGSNLALPIIILISSTSVILIPKITTSNLSLSQRRDLFHIEVNQIFKASISLSFLVPVICYILKFDNLLEIYIGYWISILINLSQIISLWYFQDKKNIRSALLLLGMILLCFGIMIVYKLGLSMLSNYALYNIILGNLLLLIYVTFKVVLKISSIFFLILTVGMCILVTELGINLFSNIYVTAFSGIVFTIIATVFYRKTAINYLKTIIQY